MVRGATQKERENEKGRQAKELLFLIKRANIYIVLTMLSFILAK